MINALMKPVLLPESIPVWTLLLLIFLLCWMLGAILDLQREIRDLKKQ